jgi:hypothetical protein
MTAAGQRQEFPSALYDGPDGAGDATCPPLFIPQNYGVAAKTALALSVHMMGVLNAHERTLVRNRPPSETVRPD